MADINSRLPVTDESDGAIGSSAPSTAETIGGVDSTGKLRAIPIDPNGGVQVTFGNKAQIDFLSRLRVSESNTVFSIFFEQSSLSLLTNTAVTGSATITSTPASASMRLTNTTSSSDSATLETKYIKYTPGRAYSVALSGTIGAAKANVTQRFGFYNNKDGLFIQQTNSNKSVVIRSSTSGSPVDTVVNQSSWNIDPLNGTGPSGYTVDFSKHNLYIIDFLWHGAGGARWGVAIGGQIIYFHQFNAGNLSTVPFMRTATLPLKVELINTGTTASSTSMDIVCMSVQRESQDGPLTPLAFSDSRGITSVNATSTVKPLISLRPKLTFNGITNRTPIALKNIQVLADAQNTLVQIYINPTLTGASFASVSTASAAETDQSATALSGGTRIAEFYVAANSTFLGFPSSEMTNALGEIILGLNVAGTTADIITVAVQSLAGGTNTFGALMWEEFQ